MKYETTQDPGALGRKSNVFTERNFQTKVPWGPIKWYFRMRESKIILRAYGPLGGITFSLRRNSFYPRRKFGMRLGGPLEP